MRRVLWVDLFPRLTSSKWLRREMLNGSGRMEPPLPTGLGEMTNVDSVLSSVLSVYSGEFASVGGDEFSGSERFSTRRRS